MDAVTQRSPAPRNRTLQLTECDRQRLFPRLLSVADLDVDPLPCGTLCADSLAIASHLPATSIDVLMLDPPYNLTKNFHGYQFTQQSVDAYSQWLDQVITAFLPTLQPTASIYVCGDWFSSTSIFAVVSRYFTVRNRITWEREKGRGAKANWKNASEDIWFCTVGDRYTFNVDDIKLRRRVLAPYRSASGQPRDWDTTANGKFRDTFPSNFWSDITIPFWSMPENTPHPTQKSEKLIAKLLLASSHPGDRILDPFVGSGTTSVVAKKLNRHYLGIEQNLDYCLLTERRLECADTHTKIQGLADGVFWERNTLAEQLRSQPP
jgi:site-specific DNA-methyltransferase (adenine-specific)